MSPLLLSPCARCVWMRTTWFIRTTGDKSYTAHTVAYTVSRRYSCIHSHTHNAKYVTARAPGMHAPACPNACVPPGHPSIELQRLNCLNSVCACILVAVQCGFMGSDMAQPHLLLLWLPPARDHWGSLLYTHHLGGERVAADGNGSVKGAASGMQASCMQASCMQAVLLGIQ